MKINEVMTRHVACARPSDSVVDAAQRMKKFDVGSLPVCGDGQRVLGMITDRDIVLRGVTGRRDLHETKVQEIMTPDVEFCFEDQPVELAARQMRQKQIRRLVVLDDDHRLVGIVSLGDLAVEMDDEMLVGLALEGISQPPAHHHLAHHEMAHHEMLS
jgi:CBS domain-containing protein